MKNYIQPGELVDWTNDTGADVMAGQAVPLNSIVGVAAADIADTEAGVLRIQGVVELPKVDAAVIGFGETVDFDASAGEVDHNQAASAAGDVADFGTAIESKGATSGETIRVLLNPGNGTPGS